jgi:hypothetical protein
MSKYVGFVLSDPGWILDNEFNVYEFRNGSLLYFRCMDIGRKRSYGVWFSENPFHMTSDELRDLYELVTYALIDMNPGNVARCEMGRMA